MKKLIFFLAFSFAALAANSQCSINNPRVFESWDGTKWNLAFVYDLPEVPSLQIYINDTLATQWGGLLYRYCASNAITLACRDIGERKQGETIAVRIRAFCNTDGCMNPSPVGSFDVVLYYTFLHDFLCTETKGGGKGWGKGGKK